MELVTDDKRVGKIAKKKKIKFLIFNGAKYSDSFGLEKIRKKEISDYSYTNFNEGKRNSENTEEGKEKRQL